MKQLKYVELKQALLDWTDKIANAIIDDTRSAKDAKDLRSKLYIRIRNFSGAPLRSKQVEEELNIFSCLAREVSGRDDSFPFDIGWALNSGASQKEFEEWAYGGLGKALANQAESILGIGWQRKK